MVLVSTFIPKSVWNHSSHKPGHMTTMCTVIQLTVTWLQLHGPDTHCIWFSNTFNTLFHRGYSRVCMSELWTDQSFELWPLPAAIKIPPAWLSSPDQHFFNDTLPKRTLRSLLLHSDCGHYIGWWQQQMLLPLLELPLTTECQWADWDSALVLMFDGGWFQSTLLTVAAENKNWLCCATAALCLWETGHWSKACDLCLFEWLAAWVTEWHIFHLQRSGPGFLCCRCLWVHIRISAPPPLWQ